MSSGNGIGLNQRTAKRSNASSSGGTEEEAYRFFALAGVQLLLLPKKQAMDQQCDTIHTQPLDV